MVSNYDGLSHVKTETASMNRVDINVTRQSFDVVSSQSEPGQRRQVVCDLHRKLRDVVVRCAQGHDGGGKWANGEIPEVVVVNVEPDEPLEGAEKLCRNFTEIIVAEEESGDGVFEAWSRDQYC